jgi:hypothetical protein
MNIYYSELLRIWKRSNMAGRNSPSQMPQTILKNFMISEEGKRISPLLL